MEVTTNMLDDEEQLVHLDKDIKDIRAGEQDSNGPLHL